MNRIMITGTNSGCGKTTVTCSLLAALCKRNIMPTAFKCGPDYIDPMFHRAVSQIKAYNLDPFFLDRNGLRLHLASHAKQFAVIEGAMGYYDGIGTTAAASAYTVAKETQTPVILVVNAGGMGYSLAATIEGFVKHRSDSQIKGVIFNDTSESRYPDLKQIAHEMGIKAYGYMPHKDEWIISSRHLGLLTTGEINDLQDKLLDMGQQAEQSIDIDGLIELSKTAMPLETPQKSKKLYEKTIRLGVAKDEAFCFMYEENLELLQALGCELVFFSPLRDTALPENINGLLLCGGYPELYVETLSHNNSMKESIKKAIEIGLPTIAEGGGFLYLHETLDDFQMCKVIKGTAFKTKQLQRFGYNTLTASCDNLLCKKGESINAREFHYWDSDCCGNAFIAQKASHEVTYSCIHATESLYAGFPHLYFPANDNFAKNFVERMVRYEG